MLSIERMTARYGGVVALADVSLTIERGSVACLLGANGAGKSTLLNALMGQVADVEGRISFDGRETLGLPTDQIVSAGMVLSPEGRQLFGDLTVEENLRIGAYLRRDDWSKDLVEILALFPRLAARRRQLAKTLSGGEQQMVAIGRALMSRPKLLLLDEPSLGLAPIFVREVMKLISTIHASGTTIFLVEQNARQALRIATQAFVLEKGRLTTAGPAATLIDDPKITAAYLGGSGKPTNQGEK